MNGLMTLLSNLNALGARHMMLTTHQAPEGTSMSGSALDAAQVATLQYLADQARPLGVTLHLRQSRKNYRGGTYAACMHTVHDLVNRSNVKLAVSTALLLRHNNSAAVNSAMGDIQAGRVGVLLMAAPLNDAVNEPSCDNAPLAQLNATSGRTVSRLVRAATHAGIPIVFDAAFASVDAEATEADVLEELVSSSASI
eukprot:m.200619 g.200619  ORF g.200619 m.200619 type:complete len:197 (-) comp21115_c0_seq1:121-711(-)